jgi:hypothetical protein
MKNIKIEIKWAIIFSVMGLLWMVLEKLCGLHGKYIDYHLYLTNLFAVQNYRNGNGVKRNKKILQRTNEL